MRQKFGFDAYGVSQDMPDPVARSMQAMLDHMHAVDQRIELMCNTLCKLDASYRKGQLPELRDEDFAEILADVESCCSQTETPAEPPRADDIPHHATAESTEAPLRKRSGGER
jgi:serine O-acetyltransferase